MERRRRAEAGAAADVARQVGVRVDQPRHERAAVEVDRRRRRTAASAMTSTIRPSSIRTDARSNGARPVPSITRALVEHAYSPYSGNRTPGVRRGGRTRPVAGALDVAGQRAILGDRRHDLGRPSDTACSSGAGSAAPARNRAWRSATSSWASASSSALSTPSSCGRREHRVGLEVLLAGRGVDGVDARRAPPASAPARPSRSPACGGPPPRLTSGVGVSWSGRSEKRASSSRCSRFSSRFTTWVNATAAASNSKT